jgi:hypothetical protein
MSSTIAQGMIRGSVSRIAELDELFAAAFVVRNNATGARSLQPPQFVAPKVIMPTASAAPQPLQALPSSAHNAPALTASTVTRPLQTMTTSAQNVAAPAVAAVMKRKTDVIDLTEDDPI